MPLLCFAYSHRGQLCCPDCASDSEALDPEGVDEGTVLVAPTDTCSGCGVVLENDPADWVAA